MKPQSLPCLVVLTALALPLYAQDFAINEGHSGTWFDSETAGQGFLIDVVPASQFVFTAWFTYEEEGSLKLGADESRWLTAQGNYIDNLASLTLNRTEGGLFDDPAPTQTTPAGTLEFEFLSCTEAVARYAFTDTGLSGEIQLERLTPDVFCGDLVPPPASKMITITYSGNEGVIIDDGDSGIAIDAIGTWASPWISVPQSVLSQLQNATAPFAHIGVAAVTHNHGDHYSPLLISNFLNTDPARRAITASQGRSSINPGTQVESILPNRFGSAQLDYGDFSVTVVNTRHFDMFGNDFSGVENYVYVVRIGDRQIIHLGDIDYAPDNFQAIADVLNGPVDAIVMPVFNTLASATNRDLIEQFFSPLMVIGAHFRTTNLNQESQAFQNLYPAGVIFDQPLEAVVVP